MGSPKRQRKKFSKPRHPWQKERILAEKEILQEYWLRRKYEIWKMNTILKNFTTQAKNLITINNPQVGKERSQLLTKLSSLGLTGKDAKIEDVLSLTLKDVLERRLQTLVYRKNLASSLKQARQFIVHEHISVGDKIIKAPSYLVPLEEENSIQFSQGSVIANASHPIRAVAKDEKKIKKSKDSTIKETEKSPGKETKSEDDKQTKDARSDKDTKIKENKPIEKKAKKTSKKNIEVKKL